MPNCLLYFIFLRTQCNAHSTQTFLSSPNSADCCSIRRMSVKCHDRNPPAFSNLANKWYDTKRIYLRMKIKLRICYDHFLVQWHWSGSELWYYLCKCPFFCCCSYMYMRNGIRHLERDNRQKQLNISYVHVECVYVMRAHIYSTIISILINSVLFPFTLALLDFAIFLLCNVFHGMGAQPIERNCNQNEIIMEM